MIVEMNEKNMSFERMGRILNRSPQAVQGRMHTLFISKTKNIYRVYRGGRFVHEGNINDCAKALGCSEKYLYMLNSPKYKKRREKYRPSKRRITIKLVEGE